MMEDLSVPDMSIAAKDSAVERAAHRLRAIALAGTDGELLGSEEDLMRMVGVSRPTLRQATALVIQDQLLRVRRGVNGGYFVAVPDSMTVSRIAALYLRSRDAKLSSIIAAINPIRTELARIASRSSDADALQQLREFLEKERAIDAADYDYKAFLRAERRFGRLLGTLSDNPVLTLFLAIVYDLTALVGSDEDVYVHHPDRVHAYRQQRNKLAEAIVEGDEEVATIASRRCSAIVAEWLALDAVERSLTSQ
jgi:DNA-binding FadR family transcriptional regulator